MHRCCSLPISPDPLLLLAACSCVLSDTAFTGALREGAEAEAASAALSHPLSPDTSRAHDSSMTLLNHC